VEVKLCYKTYDCKLSAGACKYFTDKTGLDLQTVFGDYIEKSIDLQGVSLINRMQSLSRLYTRGIASLALYSIIKPLNDSVELEEIEDATYRVSWQLSDRPDDLSEPWPVVMLDIAFQINDYFNNNIPKKKVDTSGEQVNKTK
tara:strand:+ start:2471 stop:2899 length:429 start_codon:yes stop_codon:yes gene_type:complete